MVKVMVYEDDAKDVIERYGGLRERHDVHVRLDPISIVFDEETMKTTKGLAFLVSQGFNSSQVKELDLEAPNEEADIYFVDGLRGNCYELIEKLPKESVVLTSTDPGIRSRVGNMGYQVLEDTFEPLESIKKLLEERFH